MKKLHSFLLSKNKNYNAWHSIKESNVVHWTLFLLVAVVMSSVLQSDIVEIGNNLSSLPRPMAFVTGAFSDEASTTSTTTPELIKGGGVRQKRNIKINNDRIIGSNLRIGDQISLDLFDNTKFRGIIDKISVRSAKSFTLSGHLSGRNRQYFHLGKEKMILHQLLFSRQDGTTYEVVPVGNNLYTVEQVDPANLPPEDSKNPPVQSQITHDYDDQPYCLSWKYSARPAQVSFATSPTTIDVMVAYTPRARTAAGGTDEFLLSKFGPPWPMPTPPVSS